MMGRNIRGEDWELLLFQAFRKTLKLIRENRLSRTKRMRESSEPGVRVHLTLPLTLEGEF